MTKSRLAAATFGLAVVLGSFAGSAAVACQGPQFESQFDLFAAEKAADVPEGMVQYRVRITSYSLRNVYDRDLIDVHRLTDEPVQSSTIDRAKGRLKIIKPIGTSCDSVAIQKPGIYYVVGTLLNGEDGEPVFVNGGQLFQPKFTRRKALLDFPE